jgi:UDP-3-O-[3-hydroxymyristoyl] glucosamine N-acyltransferase
MEQEKEIKLSFLAEKIGGVLHGEDITVKTFSSIDDPKESTIVLLANKKYTDLLNNSNIKAVIVYDTVKVSIDKPHIIVKEDKLVLVKLLDIFYPEKPFPSSISKNSFIAEDAKIGLKCYIGEFVYIGFGSEVGDNSYISAGVKIGNNVKIGSNVKIYSNVVIYDDTVIGDNVIIHAGAVIGSDGFGYVNLPDRHVKIRQVGNVVIENDVEIGANSCIDRAALGSTVIGKGTKIDNLVQIGHNVKIGKNCIIVSQVGIAGSCNIGNYVILAGQVGIADHVNIADGTIVMAQAGVMSDITQKGVYVGSPIMEARQFMKSQAVFKELHDIKKAISNLRGDK